MDQNSEFKTIIYEKEGNVARITFNRPEKLNAWDFPGQAGLTDDFYAALGIAEEDDDVKAIVIKGAGRAFSAGHDLNTVGHVYGMGTGKEGERRASERIRLKVDREWLVGHHQRLFLCPKITIAQVHGYCVGEGIMMLCCCDLAVATEDAQIGHTEQRLGFAGSGGGTIQLLILTVGLKRALDMLLTGKLIDGREAEQIGLVNKAVPSDKLEEEVDRLANAVCLLPRDGIAIGKATRHMVYDSLGINAGFTHGYYSHTFFTNLRWEDDEYNFFKERRDKGTKTGFHKRDERFSGLV
ncbi:MAG: enoyl-CoA hydratase/isomerase family protein [Chloroflexota bacterium]|nr:enoyl-CoA hydratase/isomerase family protein [Chloroflexota bacterium]